jgi:hypothetical protein
MKTLLNKITCGVFACSLLVLISAGCDNDASDPSPDISIQDYLLYSTFEGDDIDSAPDQSLAGQPIGDELVYPARTAIEVVPTINSLGANSISLPEGDSIEFVSKVSPFSSVVTFRLTGRFIAHNFFLDFLNEKRINVTDGRGHTLAKIIILGLSVYMDYPGNSDNDPYDTLLASRIFPESYPINDHPGSDHQHVLKIDINYSTKRFALTILGSSLMPSYGNSLKIENLPLYYDGPLSKSTRPTLVVANPVSQHSQSQYIIDAVTIVKQPASKYQVLEDNTL